jgi:hypothetical protein
MAFAPAPLPSLSSLLGSYSVSAETGAFILTGQTTPQLVRGLRLVAAAASFSLTGQEASLLKNFVRIAADAGSYAMTGQAVGLTYFAPIGQSSAAAPLPSMATLLERATSFTLAADAGEFVLFGAPSLSDYALTVEAGAFSLAGQDVAPLYGRAALAAAPGTFVLTGMPVALVGQGAAAVDTDVGAFVLAGADVALLRGLRLTADLGAYAVTGSDVQFGASRRLDAEAGVYVFTGKAVTTRRGATNAQFGRRRGGSPRQRQGSTRRNVQL